MALLGVGAHAHRGPRRGVGGGGHVGFHASASGAHRARQARAARAAGSTQAEGRQGAVDEADPASTDDRVRTGFVRARIAARRRAQDRDARAAAGPHRARSPLPRLRRAEHFEHEQRHPRRRRRAVRNRRSSGGRARLERGPRRGRHRPDDRVDGQRGRSHRNLRGPSAAIRRRRAIPSRRAARASRASRPCASSCSRTAASARSPSHAPPDMSISIAPRWKP